MKKKKIKINFMNFWEGFNPENNFFTNLLRRNYEVVIEDNPDYLFYSVYNESSKNPKNLSKKGDFIRKISPEMYILIRKIYSKIKNIFFNEKKIVHPKGNFIKIFYGAEKVKPEMSKCDFAFSVYFEEEINHPNYTRIPTHLLINFLLEDKEMPSLKRKIDFNKVKKEKINFCNFIYHQDVYSRNKFFKRLSKYKKIDSPGRCMNNMPPIGKHENAKKSRISINWAKEKLDFLKDYKFTIAFENEVLDGYTTEKLVHPLLVNSIPIYIGNKKVGRDFNKKCFIHHNDFKNMDDLIKYIIMVDNHDDLYKKYLEQPIFRNKEQYYFNSRERIIKKLNEIIESKK
jgi:alpha(1,3/1,4) fucosyltransferase